MFLEINLIENNGIDSSKKLWVKAKINIFKTIFWEHIWMIDRRNEMNVDIRYLHGILTCMLYLYDIIE